MSKDFTDIDFSSISIPPMPEGWETIVENAKKLDSLRISNPFTAEQVEYLNEVTKSMSLLRNSVPPDFIELSQRVARSLEPITRSGFLKSIQSLNATLGELSKINKRFSIKETLSKEEATKIVEEVLDQNSSESLPETIEKSSKVIQKANWNKINQLEDDEEVPSDVAKLALEDSLYNQVQEISGSSSEKVTKKKLIEFSEFVKILITFILSTAVTVVVRTCDAQTAKINSQIEQERFEEQMKLENDQKQLLEKILETTTNTCEAPKSIENPASPIFESLSQDDSLDYHNSGYAQQED